MKLRLPKSVITVASALSLLASSAAYSASATCTGGIYRVQTTDQGIAKLYVNDTLTFSGQPELVKVLDGHNYLKMDPNVGPRPADVSFEYSFVVPQFAASQVYYSYLDSRVSTFFPSPSSNVTRTPLICQLW